MACYGHVEIYVSICLCPFVRCQLRPAQVVLIRAWDPETDKDLRHAESMTAMGGLVAQARVVTIGNCQELVNVLFSLW